MRLFQQIVFFGLCGFFLIAAILVMGAFTWGFLIRPLLYPDEYKDDRPML